LIISDFLALSGEIKVKMNSEIQTNEEKLFSGTLWLNVKAMGLVLGLVSGLAIFIATNWLVLKGGEHVGPHLQLLSQYFIGYRVSFLGSFIGFAYGFAVGTICGALIGWIYNRIAVRSK
jgi:ABC-type dipeptide/oligopeptide/nickel transport system permease subunit